MVDIERNFQCTSNKNDLMRVFVFKGKFYTAADFMVMSPRESEKVITFNRESALELAELLFEAFGAPMSAAAVRAAKGKAARMMIAEGKSDG